MNKLFCTVLAAVGALLLPLTFTCGSSTEVSDEIKITGQLFEPGGKGPAQGASVVLRPCSYLAPLPKVGKRSAGDVPATWSTSTDNEGRYEFVLSDSFPAGFFTMEAADDRGNRLLIDSIGIDPASFDNHLRKTLPDDTLEPAGIIVGNVKADTGVSTAYIRIFGLDRYVTAGADGSFVIDDLPEADLRLEVTVRYAAESWTDTVFVSALSGEIVNIDTISRGGLQLTDDGKSDTGKTVSIDTTGYLSGDKITFKKIYTRDTEAGALKVLQTTDGGFIMLGWLGFDELTCVYRTDKYGDILWTKTYTSYFMVRSCPLPDGSGFIGTAAAANDGCTVIRMGLTGDTTILGTIDSIQCYSIQPAQDGGCIVSGTTEQTIGSPAILVKVDSYGQTVWRKKYITNGDDLKSTAQFVLPTNDGGYIFTGYTGGTDRYIKAYAIKTDGNGDLLWRKTFENTGAYLKGLVILKARDTGYLLLVSSGEYLGYGGYLLKIDEDGTPLWHSEIEGLPHFGEQSIVRTNDGGYVFAGEIRVEETDSFQGTLIKFDANGNRQWLKRYIDPDFSSFCDIHQTVDNGLITIGTTWGSSDTRLLLIKTDEDGTIN